MYVAEQDNGFVYVFSSIDSATPGKQLYLFNGTDVNGSTYTSWSPDGVGTDLQGYIYVVDGSSNQYLSVLAPLSSVNPPPGTVLFTTNETYLALGYAFGMTMDRNGTVYVANYFHNDVLVVSNFSSSPPCKALLTITGGESGSGLYEAISLALDTAGNMYVTSYEQNRLAVLASVTSTSAAPGTEIFSFYTSNINGIQGVALDSNGSIYLVSEYNSVVVVLAGIHTALPGKQLAVLDGGAQALSNPAGVAVDSIGRVYVTSGYSIVDL